MSDSIVIRAPDDFHVHFRQGDTLASYVQASVEWCARALVMPNTTPAIRTAEDAQRYYDDIVGSLSLEYAGLFTPLMTCKLYPNHTSDDIRCMKKAGVIACKLYPQGVTTNAEDGVHDISELRHLYQTMQECDMVLCIHGESPDAFVLDREETFLRVLDVIRAYAPKLRIVLEHVSSAASVKYVMEDTSGLLAATVTVHHLLFTLDDVIGGFLNPHLFCKPILKRPADKRALQNAVLAGNEKFFLGTDSAPHDISQKECTSGCAGIYSAPVAIPLLVDFFQSQYSDLHRCETDAWIRALESFTSHYGAQFYNVPYNTRMIALQRVPWRVSKIIAGVVPLCAGEELKWRVAPLSKLST